MKKTPEKKVTALKPKEIGAEEATAVLRKEMQKANDECWAVIMEALEKYGLQFAVTTIIAQDTSINQRIDLVPKAG